MSVSSTNNVVILNADGSTHSFTFNFKIFAASDLKVIVRSSAGVETDQTLNSQYIIPDSSVDNASGGNILFKFNTGSSSDAHFSSSDFRPANGSKVILRQNIPLTQTLDLVNNDPFDAETLESSLDRIVLQVQSVKEAVDRSIKFSRSNLLDSSGSQISSTYVDIEEDTTARANKVLSFDSTGTPIATQEIGTLKGDWAASTAYQERDIVKDTSTSNHFIVNSAHTSSGSQPLTTNTNASKYTAITNFSGATLSPGQLVVDNITIDGNTISTTNSNGDLILTPNGTGNLHVDGEIKVEGNDASEATNFVTISPSSTGGDDIFLEGVNAAIAFYDTSTNTVPRYGQGSILFYGKNASGNFVQVGSVEGYQSDATDSSVDGGIRFTGTSNNSTAEHASISGLSALLIDGLNSRFGGTVTIEDKLIMADVTSGKILIADGASYEEQAVSGDITINSSGVTAISSGVIVNADISGSAAIADSKLATITTADKVSGAAIQIDGATDGTSITVADADKLLIDDGGTTKYINASQLNTYISAAASSVAADNITAGDAAVTLTTTSGNITIDAQASNSNIILKGTDGSTDTTYLTISGGDAGAATFNSTVTATGFIIGSANINENDLEAIDGITAGTGAASKAVVLDSSSNVNNIGTISATNLNISNDVDVDGTLEADAITINGTAISSVLSPVAGHASIVTVGALDSGSITSGFGNINNGSSTITTTGAITGGAVNIGTTGSLSNNSGTFLIDANTNLNFRGGTQTFDNADGSVEYMRLNSTGLGIGTSPSNKLDIATSDNAYAARIVNNSDGSQGLLIQTSDNDTSEYILNLQSSTSATGTNYSSKFAVTKYGTTTITNETSGAAVLQVRNYATSSTGAFTGSYASEFRTVTATSTHGMLIHHAENNAARRTLDISDNTGTIASFVQGQVGIGETDPDQKLHVFQSSSSGAGMVSLIRTQVDTCGTTGDGSAIEFFGKLSGSDWGFAKIGGVNSGANHGGGIEFHTNSGNGSSASTTMTRKMVLDQEGNLGLGLGIQYANDYVDGSSGTTIVLESAGTNRGALVFASECTGGSNEILGIINFTDTANTASNFRAAAIKGHKGSGNGDAYLTFHSDNTERMRIESTGSVVVNRQDSTTGKFEVHVNATDTIPTGTLIQTADNNVGLRVWNNNNSANYSAIKLETRTSAASGWLIANEWKGSYYGDLVFRGRNGASTSAEQLRIAADGTVTILNATTTNRLNSYDTFRAGNTGRLNLEPHGNLTISFGGDSDSSYYAAIFANNSSSSVGYILVGSSATDFGTSSDYRLKENVNYDWDATSRLKQLKPVRFNFKTEPDKTIDGLIAHEVSEIVPNAVSGEKDEMKNGEPFYQGIDHSKLVPLLTKSLQEAMARIETLEAKVAKLEGG